MLVLTLALAPPLAGALLPYALGPLLVGLAVLALRVRAMSAQARAIEPPRNPLQVGAALQMTAMFQVVLFGVEVARHFWGDVGLLASGAILGLTDVDALTISMARGVAGGVSLDVAGHGLAIGALANTLLKLTIVLVAGARVFRRVAGLTLVGMAAVLGAALALWD
jgi:uncharacterized membrane protein (DUF4010 family)